MLRSRRLEPGVGRTTTMQLELPFETTRPPSPQELRERVIEYGRELLDRARAQWPEATIPDVRVEFRLRGRSAGEACATSLLTNYNAELLEKYGEDFILEIVPHEIAHVVVSRVFPRPVKPHGREWKLVMALFEAPASATHRFESKPARTLGRHPYRCRCESLHYLTTRAHRKIRRGYVEYSCRVCRERLEFAG
jgi:SprT protein